MPTTTQHTDVDPWQELPRFHVDQWAPDFQLITSSEVRARNYPEAALQAAQIARAPHVLVDIDNTVIFEVRDGHATRVR